jgi:hypothetical protein
MEFDAVREIMKIFTYVGQWFMPHRSLKTWSKYPLHETLLRLFEMTGKILETPKLEP